MQAGNLRVVEPAHQAGALKPLPAMPSDREHLEDGARKCVGAGEKSPASPPGGRTQKACIVTPEINRNFAFKFWARFDSLSGHCNDR